MLKSGYALNQAMAIMAHHDQQMQPILREFDLALQNGTAFHEVVAPFFKPNIVVQLRLAERHGRLDDTLILLGERLAGVQKQLGKVQQVMRYPLFLLGILAVMLLGAKLFLLPMFAQWGTGLDAAQGTFGYARYLWGAGVVIVALFGFFGWRYYRCSPLGRLKMLVRLPLIGRVVKSAINFQVAQELSLLLRAGLSLPAVLNELANLPAKSVERAFAVDVAAHLRAGLEVADYILASPLLSDSLAGYFDRGQKHEETGEYLNYFAKMQFEQLMNQTEQLIGLVQPVVFGAIGLAIMLLYLTLLLPMYQTIGGLYK